MKTSTLPVHRPRSGFTLVELMITITLIGLLSALGLLAMKHANTTARREKAKAHKQVIISFLDAYAKDYGTYPSPKEGGGGQTVSVGGYAYPSGGAIALYQALSGDGDSALDGGNVESQGILQSMGPSAKAYWPDLDPKTNPQRIVHSENGQYMLVDPWGAPWQYLVPPPLDVKNQDDFDKDKTKYHNLKTYDLWSFGGDPTNEKSWIKNW
ncbi:MAG: type II secretion system protein [Verrucomicrobiales bacterium]